MKKIGWFLLIILVLLCGCSGGGGQETSVSANTGFVPATPGNYDSADTAVLLAIDQEEKTLTFLNLEVEKKYTLTMDGATKLYDKYGDTLSLSQIRPGYLRVLRTYLTVLENRNPDDRVVRGVFSECSNLRTVTFESGSQTFFMCLAMLKKSPFSSAFVR